jgi:hypothetical protein
VIGQVEVCHGAAGQERWSDNARVRSTAAPLVEDEPDRARTHQRTQLPRSARVDDMRHSAACDVSSPLRVGFDERPLCRWWDALRMSGTG